MRRGLRLTYATIGYNALEAVVSIIAGVVILVLSVLVMPLLARAKRRVAQGLTSRALAADARQTCLCA
ncbi:MAG TPA: hypothetical protein VFK04_12330 [Gemmatimonadaceae bacterium]|nr:hypothetical protein [Gemmatimonadaceae bacterium]